MKIGIISDTHDDVEYTNRAIDAFEKKDVEVVIHAGDVISPAMILEFKRLTEPADSPRQKAKRIKSAKEKLYTKGRLGLLIDGTGDDYNKIKKKRQELVNLGYDTYMIFINTSLEVAQQRNAQRDRKLP